MNSVLFLELFTLVFAGTVAISTVIYATLTKKLVDETRKLREVQTEPRVTIQVEVDRMRSPGLQLVIRNNGQGPAKNVHFTFTGDASYFHQSRFNLSEVNKFSVIKDGLDNFEINQEYRLFLGFASPSELERATKSPWRFNVEYENILGQPRTNAYTIDFGHFSDMLIEPNHMKEISDNLRSIRDELNRSQLK